MREWLAFAQKADLGVDVVHTLIDQRVDRFASDLVRAGFSVVEKYAQRLLEADDLWRLEYPKLAADFPKNTSLPHPLNVCSPGGGDHDAQGYRHRLLPRFPPNSRHAAKRSIILKPQSSIF